MGTMGKWTIGLLMGLFVQTADAQTVRLLGKVSDKNGVPLDMATVVVKDSLGKLVEGCVSDSLGNFFLELEHQAHSTIHVSCIGYKDYVRQMDGMGTFLDVALDTANVALGEVTVTARTPLIQRKIDRIVLDAQKLSAIATTALDVLTHTPGVLVQDDDISMLGKGKLIFLMNGRETNMDVKALIAYLSAMPADNLKQIEVMTTPPAKYTAEGNAGIINFVARKMRNGYFEGFASNRLSVKEKTYDDASLSLQYKHDRLEAYANAGGGLGTMQYNGKRRIDYQSETWATGNRRLKPNDYWMVTGGVDYQLTKHSTVGGIVSYMDMRPDAEKTENTSVWASNANERSRYFETMSDTDVGYNRFNGNLHYTLSHIGKEGRLDVNADILDYDVCDLVDLWTTHDEDLSYRNRPSVAIRVYQAKADMEVPIGCCNFSYGAAYTQSKTDNRTNYESISTGQDLDDHFVYRESIFAAYADAVYQFSDAWEAKVGVRGEYGKLDGHSVKLDQRMVKHQLDIFPTAYLSYSWNDNHALSLSMSSRINRPTYVDINPFTTYSDAHAVTTGNPNLQPEKAYTAELGYTVGDFSVSASVMWKRRSIASYTYVDEEQKMTTTTVDNVMNKDLYSLDASYYFDKVWWYSGSINASVYTIASRPMSGYRLAKTSHASVYLYMSNDFFLNRQKTLMLSVSGNYQSKEMDVAGEFPGRYRIDPGMKWLLLGKRLTVALECQNLLASHIKSVVRTNENTYTYDSKPYRVVRQTLSCRFGKKLNVRRGRFGIDSGRL